MKRNLISAKIIILLLCFSAQITYSQNSEPFSIDKSSLSKPTSPVMDYAGVLDSATQKRLEEKVIKFKEQSNPSVELAVAIVKTTGDRPIFDYSMAFARGWGIGSREQDNPGALLFIAVVDRKYYTQVSSDLEDELPDGLVGSIQRQYLVPEFKKGNYGKGVEDTIDAYIKVINSENLIGEGGEFIPSDPSSTTTNDSNYGSYNDDNYDYSLIVPCLIFLVVLILIIFASIGGGGGGGKRRRKYATTGDDVVGDIVTGILTGLITGGSSGGSSSSDWGSGGSSSGGSWGGFGGGGDFGGGGAGGGW